MIVKDLSKSFNPYPKDGIKVEEHKAVKEGKKTTKNKRKQKKENKQR